MKKLLFAFLYRARAVRLASWWNRSRVMILCYHGVTKREERSPNDKYGLHVRVDRFNKHLDHLEEFYQVISLREFVDASRINRRLPPRSVILTFDDGYRNFLTVAASSLAQRNLPASVFLITDCVCNDQSEGPPDAWSAAHDE